MDYSEFNDHVGNLSEGTYAGLPITPVPGEDDAEIPAVGEAAWRISVKSYRKETFEGTFTRLLEKVDAAGIRALIIGRWGDGSEDNSEVIRLLADHAARLPALRSLFVGAVNWEEWEISWILQSDVTPLLEAFPLLERLEVRGGSGLELRPVRHENLKVLRFETGGLPAAVVRAVGECDLPALEYLELWLGSDWYGGDATVADLEPILSGERLPALRHLGLQDSEIQDEIAEAVASAPVVARLESLALSMGTLGDEGAEALLSGQPLTHLKRLDLHRHYLSDAMMERVASALPSADLSGQADLTMTDGERYVAVSE
ncbi:STM4015 family protein [Planobispora rosea]|uniref:STM4015 family protein n=1 Tax=Planobispora rosea TaxID=35762 RepID=UPI00083B1217|nr:STM4015 family protein [Planobispora rosea]